MRESSVPAKRSNIERGAVSLLFPAGLVGFIFHIASTGNWDGVSAWIPPVFSGLLIMLLLGAARLAPDEKLDLLTGSALLTMHIMGGATAALLGTIAWPDLPARPELAPVMAWTHWPHLLAFVLADAACLIGISLIYKRR
jgi:hypothetical protein